MDFLKNWECGAYGPEQTKKNSGNKPVTLIDVCRKLNVDCLEAIKRIEADEANKRIDQFALRDDGTYDVNPRVGVVHLFPNARNCKTKEDAIRLLKDCAQAALDGELNALIEKRRTRRNSN